LTEHCLDEKKNGFRQTKTGNTPLKEKSSDGITNNPARPILRRANVVQRGRKWGLADGVTLCHNQMKRIYSTTVVELSLCLVERCHTTVTRQAITQNYPVGL